MIYQTGSITEAAARLRMTQPALSGHLSNLEKLTGQRLFERTPRKMVPTEEAKKLYSRIISSLENLQTIESEIESKNHETFWHRAGMPHEFFHGRFLYSVNNASELENKNFYFGLPDELIHLLLSDAIDLAILTVKTEHPLLECRLLENESFLLTASVDTAIPEDMAENKAAIENWLAGQNWISFGEELPIIRRYWKLNFNKRPEINSRIIIPNLLSILKAVEGGYGISILPMYLIKDALLQSRVRLLYPDEKPAINELYFVSRKDKKNKDRIFQNFYDLLNSVS